MLVGLLAYPSPMLTSAETFGRNTSPGDAHIGGINKKLQCDIPTLLEIGGNCHALNTVLSDQSIVRVTRMEPGAQTVQDGCRRGTRAQRTTPHQVQCAISERNAAAPTRNVLLCCNPELRHALSFSAPKPQAAKLT